MFNWAVGREYLEHTPFRRGNQTLVRQELEDNRRHRRIPKEEEQKLPGSRTGWTSARCSSWPCHAGLRRGEMLALTWADVDARPGWLRLRGETTESGKTRWVPVATLRLKAVLDYLRQEADGTDKPPGRARLQLRDRRTARTVPHRVDPHGPARPRCRAGVDQGP